MPKKKKRANPNNPSGSSVLQMLLDCQANGGWPAEALKQMLDAANADPKLCMATDKLFDTHRYPDNSIFWTKHRRDNELQRILSPEEKLILDTFEQYMNQSNLLQISSRMLVKCTGLNDRTVRKCLDLLIEKGCLAVHTNGPSNKAKIYMLNPEIATVGTPTSWVTETNFWKLTGSTYDFGKNGRLELTQPSATQIKWVELTSVRMFDVGTESIGSVEDGTFQKYGILRLVDKKTAPSSANDEAALSDSSDPES